MSWTLKACWLVVFLIVVAAVWALFPVGFGVSGCGGCPALSYFESPAARRRVEYARRAGQVTKLLHHQPADGIELIVGELGVEVLVEVVDGR